jgi:hypothetical protein
MFLGSDCFHLGSDGYYVLGQNLWDSYYDGRFNGAIFAHGFEMGDTMGWSQVVP